MSRRMSTDVDSQVRSSNDTRRTKWSTLSSPGRPSLRTKRSLLASIGATVRKMAPRRTIPEDCFDAPTPSGSGRRHRGEAFMAHLSSKLSKDRLRPEEDGEYDGPFAPAAPRNDDDGPLAAMLPEFVMEELSLEPSGAKLSTAIIDELDSQKKSTLHAIIKDLTEDMKRCCDEPLSADEALSLQTSALRRYSRRMSKLDINLNLAPPGAGPADGTPQDGGADVAEPTTPKINDEPPRHRTPQFASRLPTGWLDTILEQSHAVREGPVSSINPVGSSSWAPLRRSWTKRGRRRAAEYESSSQQRRRRRTNETTARNGGGGGFRHSFAAATPLALLVPRFAGIAAGEGGAVSKREFAVAQLSDGLYPGLCAEFVSFDPATGEYYARPFDGRILSEAAAVAAAAGMEGEGSGGCGGGGVGGGGRRRGKANERRGLGNANEEAERSCYTLSSEDATTQPQEGKTTATTPEPDGFHVDGESPREPDSPPPPSPPPKAAARGAPGTRGPTAGSAQNNAADARLAQDASLEQPAPVEESSVVTDTLDRGVVSGADTTPATSYADRHPDTLPDLDKRLGSDSDYDSDNDGSSSPFGFSQALADRFGVAAVVAGDDEGKGSGNADAAATTTTASWSSKTRLDASAASAATTGFRGTAAPPRDKDASSQLSLCVQASGGSSSTRSRTGGADAWLTRQGDSKKRTPTTKRAAATTTTTTTTTTTGAAPRPSSSTSSSARHPSGGEASSARPLQQRSAVVAEFERMLRVQSRSGSGNGPSSKPLLLSPPSAGSSRDPPSSLACARQASGNRPTPSPAEDSTPRSTGTVPGRLRRRNTVIKRQPPPPLSAVGGGGGGGAVEASKKDEAAGDVSEGTTPTTTPKAKAKPRPTAVVKDRPKASEENAVPRTNNSNSAAQPQQQPRYGNDRPALNSPTGTNVSSALGRAHAAAADGNGNNMAVPPSVVAAAAEPEHPAAAAKQLEALPRTSSSTFSHAKTFFEAMSTGSSAPSSRSASAQSTAAAVVVLTAAVPPTAAGIITTTTTTATADGVVVDTASPLPRPPLADRCNDQVAAGSRQVSAATTGSAKHQQQPHQHQHASASSRTPRRDASGLSAAVLMAVESGHDDGSGVGGGGGGPGGGESRGRGVSDAENDGGEDGAQERRRAADLEEDRRAEKDLETMAERLGLGRVVRPW